MISAARALWPKPRPSLAPAAIASTFFTAPPDLDAGDVVALVGAQRVAAQQRRDVAAANAASVAATASAVGRPARDLSAKLGPGDDADRRRPARRERLVREPTPAGAASGVATKPLDSHDERRARARAASASASVAQRGDRRGDDEQLGAAQRREVGVTASDGGSATPGR